MKNHYLHRLISVIVMFSLSCSLFTGLIPGSRASKPLQASGKGPEGLTAEATSPDSVKLTWQLVEGATTYHVAVSIAGGNALPVVDLGPSTTSYEDFMAMPGSQLKYAVEAKSDSGSIGQSVVDVTTPEWKPNPLTVKAQLDTKKTATATIGPEGGSISLTDRKGVVYKLDIPAGALDNPTDITMTAVKNIGGWPLDGNMFGAVKLEPEGLVLNDVATLRMTLSQNQPSSNLLHFGFAFTGNGAEFHLTPAYDQNPGTSFVPGNTGGGHLSSPLKQTGAEIVMETLVMYGIGGGDGSAESAGSLVKNNAPTDAGAAMEQKQAVASAVVDDLADLPKINQSASPGFVAADELISAATDCGSLHTAIVGAQRWFRGAPTAPNQTVDQEGNDAKNLMNHLVDALKDVIDKTSAECSKSEGKGMGPTSQAGCLESILNKIAEPPRGGSGFWSYFQTAVLNRAGGSLVTNADNTLAKCLPSYIASGGTGYAFSGTICSLRSPFTLKADGMEHFTVDFTPTSGLSGNMNAVGTGSADGMTCTDGGPGFYLVNLGPDGSGTVTVTIPDSTLVCGNVSKHNTVVQVFNITPLAQKPAGCK